MSKRPLAGKLGLVLLVSLFLMMPSAEAWARERQDARPSRNRHEVVVVKHRKYHYRDGRFYWPTFFNFGFFVVRPPLGAVVRVLPTRHKTIVFGGVTYYHYDDVYYRTCPGGYMVVPAPAPSQNVTIHIPNSRGGYTAVTLVKEGNGYVGPQGEYYPGRPNVEQLKALYGK